MPDNTKPPSLIFSVIYGAVGLPAFAFIMMHFQSKTSNNIIFGILSIIGFVIPYILCTTNIRYIRKKGIRGFFDPPWSRESRLNIIYPAWERTIIIFFSMLFVMLMISVFTGKLRH